MGRWRIKVFKFAIEDDLKALDRHLNGLFKRDITYTIDVDTNRAVVVWFEQV